MNDRLERNKANAIALDFGVRCLGTAFLGAACRAGSKLPA